MSLHIFKAGMRTRFKSTALPSTLAGVACTVIQRTQYAVRVRLDDAIEGLYVKGSVLSVSPNVLAHKPNCGCKVCKPVPKPPAAKELVTLVTIVDGQERARVQCARRVYTRKTGQRYIRCAVNGYLNLNLNNEAILAS